MAFDNDYDAVLSVQARRDRLDAAIAAMAADSQFTPLVARLGCLRGISTLTGFALAVEIGDWHRFTGNTIGAFVGLILANIPPAPRGCKARLPRPATRTRVGCWSKRRGTIAGPTVRPWCCGAAGRWPPRRPGLAVIWATAAYTTVGPVSCSGVSDPSSPMWPSPANSPGGAGPSPSCRTNPPSCPREPDGWCAAPGAQPRDLTMSSPPDQPRLQ